MDRRFEHDKSGMYIWECNHYVNVTERHKQKYRQQKEKSQRNK